MVKFDRIIKPGEQGKVELSLAVPEKAGPFMKRAIVYTNDKEKQKFALTLRGVVEEDPKAEKKVIIKRVRPVTKTKKQSGIK